MVRFNSKRSDWLAYLDEVEGHATKLYFFVMATRAKRTKFTAEEVLVQMENENEFDSDHGGLMSNGEESDIIRQLIDFDEESR